VCGNAEIWPTIVVRPNVSGEADSTSSALQRVLLDCSSEL
jgi:hypothetical protein